MWMPNKRLESLNNGNKKLPKKTSSYLADGQQKIDVVWPDKVLRELQDCAYEGLFSVVVSRHLRDRSGKLRNFDFSFVVPLAAGIKDLSLTGLEAVDDAWDRTSDVQKRVTD